MAEHLAFRIDVPMRVERSPPGSVSAWLVLPEGNQLILEFAPAAADETGKRLRTAARDVAIGPPVPSGVVAKVGLIAPFDAASTGELVITLDTGHVVRLTIGLHDLQSLADTASSALAAVPPSGSA